MELGKDSKTALATFLCIAGVALGTEIVISGAVATGDTVTNGQIFEKNSAALKADALELDNAMLTSNMAGDIISTAAMSDSVTELMNQARLSANH